MRPVDTSVRVDHPRNASAWLRNRGELPASLHALPAAPRAGDDAILHLIARHALPGRGIGPIDVHPPASCLLAHPRPRTLDRRPSRVTPGTGVVG